MERITQVLQSCFAAHATVEVGVNKTGTRDTESYEPLQARQNIHPADHLGNLAFYDCISYRRPCGAVFLYVEGCGPGGVVLVGGWEPGHRHGLSPVADASRG